MLNKGVSWGIAIPVARRYRPHSNSVDRNLDWELEHYSDAGKGNWN